MSKPFNNPVVTAEDIIDFLSKQMWVRKSRLQPDTDIKKVLGKKYQRNMIFMNAWAENYNVDMSEFKLHRHFKLPNMFGKTMLIFPMVLLSAVAFYFYKADKPLIALGIFIFVCLLPGSYKKFKEKGSRADFLEKASGAFAVAGPAAGFVPAMAFSDTVSTVSASQRQRVPNEPTYLIPITPQFLAEIVNKRKWPKEIYEH